MKILFIDHHDSFSNNIVSFFRAKNFCVNVILYSNPCLLTKHFPLHEYQLIIFSPGPGSPSDYAQSIQFYLSLPPTMLVLGICLGHQIMLHATGGVIQQISARPVHGKQIYLNTEISSRLFGKIKFVGTIVLYNSLGCHKNDPVFDLWDAQIVKNGICLMAEHGYKRHVGVQFHPESFASSIGAQFFNLFIGLLHQ